MTLNAKALFASLLLSALPAVHAELAWEKTEIELHPKIGDKEAVAKFKYENKGDKPITFKSVRSSCGCTVAKPEKEEVAPGEKGEITATFSIGGRTGLQQKSIAVETDDPEQASLSLLLKVAIPQELEMQPAFVYWATGEAPKPKTITIKPGEGIKVTKLDVTSSSPEFTTKVDKGSAPSEFVITIAPKDTAKVLSSTLTIKSDYPKTLYAIARVTPPPPAGQ
jgi:hypothetical protein